MASKTINALFTAAAVSALLAGTYAVAAQGGKATGPESGAQTARPPAVSLEQAIAKVREHYQGTVVETELEREEGAARYEVKLIDAQGQHRKVYVDAASGELRATRDRYRGEDEAEDD